MRATLSTLAILTLTAGACGPAETPDPGDSASAAVAQASEASSTPSSAVATAAAEDLPPVLVYKNAGCGCCSAWVEHLRAAGFAVDARDADDLEAIKRDAGVTSSLAACHTAIVDGYVVEGHVPAAVIKRLLAERPDIVGLSVPGMPAGSPGMESANPVAYEVLAFDHQGNTHVYAEVDPH